MSYRSRVEAAILTGTPFLRALWWALNGGGAGRASHRPRYVAARARSRRAA